MQSTFRPDRPASTLAAVFNDAHGGAYMVTTIILRLPTVKTRTGLARSTIYLRIAQGTFPEPIRLGGRAVGWLENEVQAWLDARVLASRSAAAE